MVTSNERTARAAGGETTAHRQLKRLALAWAQANGFAIAAPEVRVPRTGYRADVAAIGRGAEARTVIFECKQARADLRKDVHDDATVAAQLAAAIARRDALERLLAVHRPDLRRGETLWPEYDAWDFSALEHRTYKAVVEEIERLQQRKRGGTKFAKLRRYRAADFLYLVVEDNIFAEAEIPAGWGLLVRRGEALELRRKPAALDAASEQRRALLETIAVAGTRAVNRAEGIVVASRFDSDGPDSTSGQTREC